MKLVIRVILNIFLFVIYSLIGMNAINFIYDLILSLSGKPVPVSNDPVHLKIAGLVFILISLFTIIFRKYFYLKLNKNILSEKVEEKIINSISFEEVEKKVDKEIKFKKKLKKKEKPVLKEGDMEIFMGKEIK